MPFVRSLTACPELAEGVTAWNGRADWAALAEPRAPAPSHVPSEAEGKAEGLASGPIH